MNNKVKCHPAAVLLALSSLPAIASDYQPFASHGNITAIANQLAAVELEGGRQLMLWTDMGGRIVWGSAVGPNGEVLQGTAGYFQENYQRDDAGRKFHRVLQPRLTRLADGSALGTFIASPDYNGHRSLHHEIYAMRFYVGADGLVYNDEIRRITHTGESYYGGVSYAMANYSIASRADGSLLLAWPGQVETSDGSFERGIYVQPLANDGTSLAAQQRVAQLPEYEANGWTSLAYDAASDRFFLLWSTFTRDNDDLRGVVISGDLATVSASRSIATARPNSWSSYQRIWHSAAIATSDGATDGAGRLLVLYTDSAEGQVVGCWFDQSLNALGSCLDVLDASASGGAWSSLQIGRLGASRAAIVHVVDKKLGQLYETVLDLDSGNSEVVRSPLVPVASIKPYMMPTYYPFASAVSGDYITLYSHRADMYGYDWRAASRIVESNVDLSINAPDVTGLTGDPITINATLRVNSGSGEVPSLAGSSNPVVEVGLPEGVVLASATGCDWDAATSSCTLHTFMTSGAETGITLVLDTSALAGATSSTTLPVGLAASTRFGIDPAPANNFDSVGVTLDTASSHPVPAPRPTTPPGQQQREHACDNKSGHMPRFCQ